MEAGHVPAPGESFTLRGWTFTVLEADRKLILRLRMEPADSAASRQTAGQDTAQQDGEQGAGPEAAQDAAQDEASDDPAVAPRYETLPGSLGAAAPLDDAAASPQAAVQAAEEILRSTPPPAAETGDDAPRPTESPRV